MIEPIFVPSYFLHFYSCLKFVRVRYKVVNILLMDISPYTSVIGVICLNSMRHRPFPEEEDLASLDEEALKAQAEVDQDENEEEEWLGEIELSKINKVI